MKLGEQFVQSILYIKYRDKRLHRHIVNSMYVTSRGLRRVQKQLFTLVDTFYLG